jgi:uncharacterized protein
MYYGVARLELLVPQSQSLKEKRAVLHRLKDRLESRLRLVAREVDFQDLWQRAALGIALVGLSPGTGREGLLAARREAEQDPRIVLLDFQLHVARFGDEAAAGEAAEPSEDVPEEGDRG